MLKPAFATALAAGVVLFVTVFLADRTPDRPEHAKNDIQSLLASPPSETARSHSSEPSASEESGAADKRVRPAGVDQLSVQPSEKQEGISPTKDADEQPPKIDGTDRKGTISRSESKKAVSTPSRSRPSRRGKKARRASSSSLSPGFAPPPPASKPKARTETNNALGAAAPFDSPPSSGAAPAKKMKPEKETAPRTESTPAAEMDDLTDERREVLPLIKERQKASTEAPISEDGSYRQGRDAFVRGDCTTAISSLTKAVSHSSLSSANRARAMFQLGQCERRQGRCGRALRWFDRLIADYQNHESRPKALLEAARCRRRLGQTGAARALLLELKQIPGWSEEATRQLDTLDVSP